ncbi:23S rRNA (uracil(1939)-C(5))-methyltransferase RlmD [Acidihalobacter ferrooxydans]|uniref:23S rRNA (uracil(1939)-C(5))-methyltransferase RlmD n=1 Tax=Acidihalobacter ferrooxydans TaxID=1765967 RepID=A0A1P8UEW3_9GAMM|nr:23S rRNA (uracil(1939)-C(5))-methyltransferase RlmD [Acidihalobacter ferrooxydans]APZ42370.1 23S rRNA (uracil(1939)-C(5))-methyltransferase [Acidihalobacter ferrooxydans]
MARRHRQRRGPPRAPAELYIEALAQDGRGVAHCDGKAVFVAGGLPGERVRATFVRAHRGYDEAEVEAVLEAAPERVEPRCPHFGVCGGCCLQHLDPAAQIEARQRTLLDALQRIGGVQPARVLEPLTAPVWGYRRKARLGVRYVLKKGRVLIGFRERQGRLLADLSRCEVLVPEVGERLGELAALIERLSVREQIPQIEVMAGDEAVCLVFRHLTPLSDADRAQLTAFAQTSELYVALQPGGPNTIAPLWPAEQPLYYAQPEFGTRVDFRPGDFIQVNAPINRQMVVRALELLDVQPGDAVLELFAGLGNFTLPLLARGAHVTAIEGDPAMTRRAAHNVAANGFEAAEHYAADLMAPDPEAVWLRRDYAKLLLDPPRSGAKEMLAHIGRLAPERIVYVSCDPATLARDTGELVKTYGYRLEAAGVMDMFAHTAHVESIALFVR